MKNFLLFAIGCTIVFAVACREVNKELITNVEAGSAELKQVIPGADSLAKQAARLLEQMNSAPVGIQVIPEYNFAELQFKARAISDRSLEAINICTNLSNELDSLLQGYQDGNIKEESLKAAIGGLSEKIKGMPVVIQNMQPIMAEISGSYAKVLEKWEALPDSEKKQAASNASSFSTQPLSVPPAGTQPAVTDFTTKPKN